MSKTIAAISRVLDALRKQVGKLERRVLTIEGASTAEVPKLIELLTQYPGGMRRLAEAIGKDRDTLYNFANAKNQKFNRARADAIVVAFDNQGKRITADAIREAWWVTKREAGNV